MDEITLRALLASVMLAAAMGPLGSLVVWRRLAYFGDTIAHAALLGVAISLIANVVPMTLAMFGVALVVALLMARGLGDGRFHSDTLLGILAHGTLALGLLLVSMTRDIRVDVNAYLFGDVLAVDWADTALLAGLCSIVLVTLAFAWRPLLMVTIDRAIAHVEGVNVKRSEQMLVILLAAVIAVAIKLVGVLLITALLIMPAAAARYLAKSPAQMAVIASIVGMFSVSAGLYGSIAINAPTGPLMVVVAALSFLLCGAVANVKRG